MDRRPTVGCRLEQDSNACLRIDGPRLWIEWVNTDNPGESGIHNHTIYRDKEARLRHRDRVMTWVRRLAAGAALALAFAAGAALAASPAQAHGPASTLLKVSLDSPSTAASGPTVRIVAKIALQELDIAYGTTLMDEANSTDADATVAAHEPDLKDLIGDRVRLHHTGR